MKIDIEVRNTSYNMVSGVWYVVENTKNGLKNVVMVSPFKRYDGRPDMSSDILFIDGQIDTITVITSGVYRILGKASEIKVIL